MYVLLSKCKFYNHWKTSSWLLSVFLKSYKEKRGRKEGETDWRRFCVISVTKAEEERKKRLKQTKRSIRSSYILSSTYTTSSTYFI